MMYWTTLPVLPISIFVLSWSVRQSEVRVYTTSHLSLDRHLYLGARRAEERALNVPKYAMSIFLMMIPLATAVFDASKKTNSSLSQSELMKLTAEQKRKIIKSVSMKEGPRPRQVALVAVIWMISTFFGFERILALQMQERGSLVREYFVRPWQNSSREVSVFKHEDTLSCTVWNHPSSLHGVVVWVLIVLLPLLLGPVLASLLEVAHFITKKCSRSASPTTPSRVMSWLITLTMAVLTLTTYTTHLWLAERVLADYNHWDYFTSLTVKYFFGNFEIFLVPLVPLLLDRKIRDGVLFIFSAKKKGMISKQNSVYSEYM